MNDLVSQHLASKDPVLKPIIDRIQLSDLVSTQNVFHDLMSCIIEQQIHYRSTKKTFQKMMDTAGLKELTIHNFETFEEKGLRQAKLSTNKYETILRILHFFEEQSINWLEQEDAAVKKLLSQIKGVGAWTIDMILLYTLERPAIFPADDYHLKQMMQKLYPIDPSSRVKAQMKEIAKQWAPYQSYGVRYLLDWKAFQKKQVL